MTYKSSDVDASKLSPWLDGTPELPGLYERRAGEAGAVLAYWDGTRWYMGAVSRSVRGAMDYYALGCVSMVEKQLPYRGLNFNPA